MGWRYWPDDLTQEERNRSDNLILLCAPCHKLIDRVSPRDFSLERLHEWKRAAEGDAIDNLSGETLDVAALRAALVNALQVRPHLELTLPVLASSDGLSFASRSAEFSGRSDEKAELLAFLQSEEVFSWWEIVGDAGAGKSRLALECCLDIARDWDVGFARDADLDALLEFVPIRQTLLVVDYAAARADWLGRFLIDLADRCGTDWEMVRVLVLERSVEGKWHEAATRQSRHHESIKIMSARYAKPLELRGLSRDGNRRLIADFLSRSTDLPSPTLIEDLVDRALELDPAGRPLFSLVAALEFLDPELSGGSRDTVLRALVSRRNAREAPSQPLSYTVLELAATALGGIEVGNYPALQAGEIPPFTLPALSNLAPADIDSALGGMVPDILGEMWILDELGAAGVRANASRAALGVVWGYSPPRYAAFFDRAARDHPSHEQLLELLNVDWEKDPETWFEMACSVLPYLRDPRSSRVTKVLDLLNARPPSDQRARALSEAESVIADLWQADGALEKAHALYTKVIESAPAGGKAIWNSHTNRGVVELKLGNRAQAEADFAAVISSPDASDEARACCLNNRADLRMDEGKHLAAIADRTAVLRLPETTYNRRYIALIRRAISFQVLDRSEEADADIEMILTTADIAVEQKMAARLMRAEWADEMDAPEIAVNEIKRILASRRNFPHIVEAAKALAVRLGTMEGSVVAAP